MIQRTLGKTGWKVSAIGFGAWGIGGQWGAVERSAAIESVKAAYEAGVNFFDTADAYGEPQGLSEELTGQALRGVRDRVLIASKVGNWARRFDHPLSFTHPLHIKLCCHASLHRLGMDHLDLYQCHIGGLKQPEVFLQGFDELMKEGKIRAFGISTDSLEVLKLFNSAGQCAAVQCEYSLVNRRAEKELLPYCQQNNIGVIVRGPLGMGIATGKFTPETHFADSVRSSWNGGTGREQFLKRLAVMDKLRFLETAARTMAQAALQFVISHPAVSVAIPGAKSPEQARANAAAGNSALEGEELKRAQAATE